MRSKKGKYTPREMAILFQLGWIEAMYKGLTEDLKKCDDRDSYRVQVRSALAKDFNRLAARVKSFKPRLDEEDVSLPKSVASTVKYLKEG